MKKQLRPEGRKKKNSPEGEKKKRQVIFSDLSDRFAEPPSLSRTTRKDLLANIYSQPPL